MLVSITQELLLAVPLAPAPMVMPLDDEVVAFAPMTMVPVVAVTVMEAAVPMSSAVPACPAIAVPCPRQILFTPWVSPLPDPPPINIPLEIEPVALGATPAPIATMSLPGALPA